MPFGLKAGTRFTFPLASNTGSLVPYCSPPPFCPRTRVTLDVALAAAARWCEPPLRMVVVFWWLAVCRVKEDIAPRRVLQWRRRLDVAWLQWRLLVLHREIWALRRQGASSGGQYQGSGPSGELLRSDFSLPHCHHHGPQGSDLNLPRASLVARRISPTSTTHIGA